jgi:shikimate kinase
MINNIYLIGFMGTGKTLVGKKLAELLNWTFVDIDMEIEKMLQVSISEIFDKYGEEEFRKKESIVLDNIVNKRNLVVSTGGGIVLNYKNINKMKESGLVITLIARPEVICERLKSDNTRPLLAYLDDNEKLEEIKKLLFMRAGLYVKGDYIIDTSDLDPLCAVEDIIAFYNEKKINN